MRYLTIDDVDLKGKTVLVRVDFNVPMQGGVVQDAARIERVAETIEDLRKKQAKIVLISHLGRPTGGADGTYSLQSIAPVLSDILLGDHVAFSPDYKVTESLKARIEEMVPGDVLLMENLRFNKEEYENCDVFAQSLSELADYYVNEAFSASHRNHASIDAITKHLPSLVGRSFLKEIEALEKFLEQPQKPIMAIVGGSKVSTKMDLLEKLISKVDILVVAGGIAHTILLAKGCKMGASICEPDKVALAERFLEKVKSSSCELVVPSDFIVAKSIQPGSESQRVNVENLEEDDIALDIGSTTVKEIQYHVKNSKTLLWNGPLGFFEVEPYDRGTAEVAQTVTVCTEEGTLVSIAGGGDTVAALTQAGYIENFSYISTAGGAFLQFVEGKPLPGLEGLKKSGANESTCTIKNSGAENKA